MEEKLLKTDEFYLLVYETKKDALDMRKEYTTADAAAIGHRGDLLSDIISWTDWWKTLCVHQAWYSEPGDVFLLLEEDKDGKLLKVLHGNRVGWIFNPEWVKLEPVV